MKKKRMCSTKPRRSGWSRNMAETKDHGPLTSFTSIPCTNISAVCSLRVDTKCVKVFSILIFPRGGWGLAYSLVVDGQSNPCNLFLLLMADFFLLNLKYVNILLIMYSCFFRGSREEFSVAQVYTLWFALLLKQTSC